MGHSNTSERALEPRYIIYPSSEISEAQVPIKKLDFRASTFFSPFSLSLLSSYNIKHNPSYSLWLSSSLRSFNGRSWRGNWRREGIRSLTLWPVAVVFGRLPLGPGEIFWSIYHHQLGLRAAAANIERSWHNLTVIGRFVVHQQLRYPGTQVLMDVRQPDPPHFLPPL